jgi:hypothetical protein
MDDERPITEESFESLVRKAGVLLVPLASIWVAAYLVGLAGPFWGFWLSAALCTLAAFYAISSSLGRFWVRVPVAFTILWLVASFFGAISALLSG